MSDCRSYSWGACQWFFTRHFVNSLLEGTDESSWARFFELYQPAMVRFVAQHCRNGAAIEHVFAHTALSAQSKRIFHERDTTRDSCEAVARRR